jgi:hypothetical protein
LKMSGHVHRDTDVDAAMWRTFSRALRRLRSKTPETDPPDHTWDI